MEDLVARIDHEVTDANCIASGNPEAGRVPIALADEAEATRAALCCTPGVDTARPRIVRIESTLALGTIELSEPLLAEARRNSRLHVEQ